jgi:hypothetical protein
MPLRVDGWERAISPFGAFKIYVIFTSKMAAPMTADPS